MTNEDVAVLKRHWNDLLESTINSPWFRALLREAVLNIFIAHERIGLMGVIESFVEHCCDGGFKFSIERGKMKCLNYRLMPYRLKEFYEANYYEIKRYVKRLYMIDDELWST